MSEKKTVFPDCRITTRDVGERTMREHHEHGREDEGWDPRDEGWPRPRVRTRGRGPGPGRRGGPFGPGFGPMGFGFGPWMGEAKFHRGPRVRRGDVRAAALALLAEE